MARSGGMPGTASLAVSWGDGIDWVHLFNSIDGPAGAEWNQSATDRGNAIGAAGF